MDASSISGMEKKEKKMRGAIAVFVKTPGLSPIKTRLAKEVSNETALQLYKYSVKAVNSVLQSVDGINKYWAVAEKEGVYHPFWKEKSLLYTGEGSLGERLNNIYTTLKAKYDFVILLGSDNPQINSAIIDEAVSLLSTGNKCVIGPANDGGFYLFGCTERIERNVWVDTEYSSSKTLENLSNNLNINYKNLQSLTDMDDMLSLKKLRGEFTSINLAQEKFVKYAEAVLAEAV